MDFRNSDQTPTSTFNVLPLLYLEFSHEIILICIRVRIHTSGTNLIKINYLYLWLSVQVGASSLVEAVVVVNAPGSEWHTGSTSVHAFLLYIFTTLWK